MTAITPLLLRADQVAEVMAISPSTVWTWARNGKLPKPVKWQGVTVWRMQDLQEHVDGLAP